MYSPKEKLHLAELSRQLNEAHPTLRQWLIQLEDQAIVTKEVIGKMSFFQLNNNSNLIDYLAIAEKQVLIKKSKEDIWLKEVIGLLRNEFNNTIILFGSSFNSIKKANDIDLIIEGKYNKNSLKKIEKKINKKFHNVNIFDIFEITDVLKKEVTKKHLIIQNTEKVLKWILKNRIN